MEAGIKTISLTPIADGLVRINAQIDMPGMICSLTVELPRKNYNLKQLQNATLQMAIDKLCQLRDLAHGEG